MNPEFIKHVAVVLFFVVIGSVALYAWKRKAKIDADFIEIWQALEDVKTKKDLQECQCFIRIFHLEYSGQFEHMLPVYTRRLWEHYNKKFRELYPDPTLSVV